MMIRFILLLVFEVFPCAGLYVIIYPNSSRVLRRTSQLQSFRLHPSRSRILIHQIPLLYHLARVYTMVFRSIQVESSSTNCTVTFVIPHRLGRSHNVELVTEGLCSKTLHVDKCRRREAYQTRAAQL